MDDNHTDTRSSDSTDAKVTQDLIETLVDGQNGFADAADKLAEDRPDIAARFRDFSAERGRMADELRTMAARYGDVVDSDGSVAAAVHRGWMSLKDALTGSDADAVVKAASTGEDHAVAEFQRALESNISADLRTTVQRQLTSIEAARRAVETMVGADA